MAAEDCIEPTAAAGGYAADDPALADILRETEARMRRKIAAGADLFSASRDAGAELAAEKRIAAMIERRNAAKNVLVKQALNERATTGGAGREATVVREVLTGKEGATTDSARSIDAERHAITARLQGPMVAELRKEGLLTALRRRVGEFDRDVARELWRLEDPEAPASGNRLAAKTAEILHKAQETSRALQNEAGAWIGKLDHYITRQSHDMWKVRGNGSFDGPDSAFSKWATAILPKLDDRTFANLSGPDEIPGFLANVWRNLSSGLHDASTSETMAGFKGPGNLGKKVSAERVLHFKSADDWFDYNQQFGKGGVIDSINARLVKSGRDIALMRNLGTNPEAMYRGWVDGMSHAARDRGDFATVDALRSDWNNRILDVVTGKANIPAGNGTLARIGATARALEQLSKLGSVVLSSIPDLAVNASMLRHNGIPFFESYARQIRELLPGKTAESRELADQLAVGIDGMLGDVIHRFSASDMPIGKMSHLVETFHRLNGLTYWTDSLKNAAGLMLSNNLGRVADRSFADLAPRLQTTLRRYGIEQAQWEAIRPAVQIAADGNLHLLPDAVRALPVEGADRLGDRLHTYIIDQTREGMTEPTAGTRAMATWGTQGGTVAGELVRAMMQFKMFTLTFMDRSIGRELRRDGVDAGGIAHLIAGTTILGYVAMTLKEIAKGREPRQPDDVSGYAKLVSAAMVQGGGLGIYGDFLFGQANRMGGGLAETIAGPAAGTLGDAIRVLQSLRDGGIAEAGGDRVKGHPVADLLQFAKNNAPFVNLFYTRAALDYLVLYSAQEMANPGYLRRYERQVEKQNNQKFWLSPSRDHVPVFGR